MVSPVVVLVFYITFAVSLISLILGATGGVLFAQQVSLRLGYAIDVDLAWVEDADETTPLWTAYATAAPSKPSWMETRTLHLHLHPRLVYVGIGIVVVGLATVIVTEVLYRRHRIRALEAWLKWRDGPLPHQE